MSNAQVLTAGITLTILFALTVLAGIALGDTWHCWTVADCATPYVKAVRWM